MRGYIEENGDEIVTSRVFQRAGVVCLRTATRPDVVVNLPVLARSCHYRVDAVSEALGLSSRHVNLLFVNGLGIGLKVWLRELRFVDMVHYLREGRRIDEVAMTLGLAHARQVHRDIAHFSGMPWREFMERFVLKAGGTASSDFGQN
jgi:AraC-like DNA-binding protein